MKTLSMRILTFFGIALLAAAMIFFFASCPASSDDDDDDKYYIPIPDYLPNTAYTHTSGDTISFDKDAAVTITPSGKQPQTFELKATSDSYDSEGQQYVLYYKDKKSQDDTITYQRPYQDPKITKVNFSIIDQSNRTNGWSKNPDIKYFYFSFDSYSDSGLTIDGYNWPYSYNDDTDHLIIPSDIAGVSVTKIKENAFEYQQYYSGNKEFAYVTIPLRIKIIESNAFKGQMKLTTITIGKDVSLSSEYGDPAFENGFDNAYNNQFNKAAGTYKYSGSSWSQIRAIPDTYY